MKSYFRAYLGLGAALLVAGIAAVLAYPDFSSRAMPAQPAGQARKVLYWWDPMIPSFKSDKPGKSPMGMEMVPVFEGEEPGGPAGTIKVAPGTLNNLGVRTAAVTRAALAPVIESYGTVGFDESRTSHVHVRKSGWLERLVTRAEGEPVTKGQLVAELFAPELITAAFEYVQLTRPGTENAARARSRLMALGLAEKQIDDIRRTGTVPDRIQILAPRSGVIVSLGVAEGMFVEPDTTLMSITELDPVWVIAELVESQSALVRPGMRAEISLAGFPGRIWTGSVDYLYPELRMATRTVRVRIKVPNGDGALKPNMFARVRITGAARAAALTIPSEALIRTGNGDRVVLALDEGRFRAVPVKAGLRFGDQVEIREGLNESDRVVRSSQFLLDSESSLAAGLERISSEAPAAAAPIWTKATVNSAPDAAGMVNLSHAPIPAIGWPAMTMDFALDPAVPVAALPKGAELEVALAAFSDGAYGVVAVRKPGATP